MLIRELTEKISEEANRVLDENISDALTEAGYDISDVEFLKANGKIHTYADSNVSNLIVEGKLICSWLPPKVNYPSRPKDFPVSENLSCDVGLTIPFYKPGDKSEKS